MGGWVGMPVAAMELLLEEPTVASTQSTRFRAIIAGTLGERERAMRLLAQSRPSRLDPRFHIEPLHEPLSDYPPFQEFLRPKGSATATPT